MKKDKTKAPAKEKSVVKKKKAEQAEKSEKVQKAEKRTVAVSFNMLIAAFVILVLIISAGFASYFLITDRVLVRSPMLVQVNPKITFIVGEAFYREKENQDWKIAIVGQTLGRGYEVRLDPGARMDIRFHEDTAIRLNENSRMTIDDLTIRKMKIRLEEGSMYGIFSKLFRDHEMSVNTPTAIAGIRGTELGFEAGEKELIPEKSDEAEDENGVEDGEEDTVETADKSEEKEDEIPSRKVTTVYSLSGITEVYNPDFSDDKVLLSYNNSLILEEGMPPSNPEKLSEKEVLEIRALLNSINFDEVLVITDQITFSVGSAEIDPSSYPELERIKEILEKKKVKVRIEGHTDSRGDASFNQTLSEERAEAIKEHLVGEGLDPDRFETAGFGETKPIASNETGEGRAQNRRVEFLIVE